MKIYRSLSLIFLSLIILTCSKESDVASNAYASSASQNTYTPPTTTTTTTTTVTQFTLAVTAAEGGSVSSTGGTYDDGTSVSITATPNEGYEFIGWNGTDMSSSTITIMLTANTTIEALFSQVSTITVGENIEFIYNLHESLPSEYITEFNTIMDNLIATFPATQQTWLLNPNLNIYAWNNSTSSPYTDPNGNSMQGASISGNGESFWMILEIPNAEFTNNSMHRYSVIAHEYFHVYQLSLSENFAAPSNDPNGFDILWLAEGTAVNFESLYIQQYYDYNYYNDFTSGADFTQVTTNPASYESYDVGDMNYSGSGFMILALVSELQKIGFSEEKAFQSVFKTFWESNPNSTNWKTKFEEVFTISVDNFYLMLESYSTDVSLLFPSSSITIQNIINDNSSISTSTTDTSTSTDVPTYSISVTASNGGTVSTEGGDFEEGTEVTITATANEGYRFTGWEGSDSTSESLTITLNSDQTYQALFELIPLYTLSVTAAEGGGVSSTGGTYNDGTEVTITATANEGYRFTGWEGSDSTSESLTVILNSDQTYQALFELIPVSDTSSRIIWSGPTVQFSKEDGSDSSQESNQDRITSNVWITRGNGGQIFNIAKENSANKANSPAGTLWATGSIDNIDNLTFEPFRTAVGQPKAVVGSDLVLYLVDDDIYLSVKFTSWSQGQKGGFAYERSSE